MSRPWFSFYVGDYLRDTSRLTTEAHGAYLLLILDYWTQGAPPDDDETLASIARLSLEHWCKLRPKLEGFFEIVDGRWTHKRVEKELEIAAKKHEKRVAAGKAGGNATAKAKQSFSNAEPMPPALPYQSQPQSQSDKKKEKQDADADASHSNGSAPSNPEKDLFDRGKQVLGSNSGGLIKRLLTAKDNNIAYARAAIEQASQKSDPREYIGKIIRSRDGPALALERPDRSW